MIPSELPAGAAREKASRHKGRLRPIITPGLSLLYMVADAATVTGTLALLWAWFGQGGSWPELFKMAALGAMALFLTFASRHGLYRSWRVSSMREEVVWVLMCWALSVAFLSLLMVFAGYDIRWQREPVIVSWYIVAGVSLVLQRYAVRHVFRAIRVAGRNYRHVAVLGATEQAADLLHRINKSAWMGLRLHGVFDDRKVQVARTAGLTVVGDSDALLRAARDGTVDVVYITLPLHAVEPIRKKILALMDTTVSVYLVPDLYVFGLIDSRIIHFDDMPIFTVAESPFSGIEGWAKRVEDFVLGSLIMLAILVPMMAIAIGIKLTSPGPVFFRQKRYGLDGQPILVWKFRSMRVTEDGATQFRQASRKDPRVTRFGAFLRRTSLDELPQFINVLLGTMSIVGPRPHPVALNESFRGLVPGYMLRHKVKPGITGWAQINGWRGETDTLEKMERRIEYDLDYIRRWSIWLDLRIIALTIVRGFTGTNAY